MVLSSDGYSRCIERSATKCRECSDQSFSSHSLQIMSKHFDLLSLPTRVVCDVLCERLSLKWLVRLDSAFCQRLSRSTWLTLVSSKQFTLSSYASSRFACLQWLLKKRLKVSKIRFDADDNTRFIAAYLKAHGSSLREVTFQGNRKAHDMALVAAHCEHIRSLSVKQAYGVHELRHILWRNLKIEEVCFVSVAFSDQNVFDPLPNDVGASNIRTIVINNSAYTKMDVLMMIVGKPSQQTRSANFAYLQNLSLAYCSCLGDDDVHTIVNNFPHLRGLNIQHDTGLTKASVQHIVAHDGFEVLYIDLSEPSSMESEHILHQLCRQCVKLKYLNMNCHRACPCVGRATSILVNKCVQLRTLVCRTIGESSIEFIRTVRPGLQVLDTDARHVLEVFRSLMYKSES